MDFTQTPQRSILYYPTITVPNGVWLRRALLYWDRVASIVPQEGYDRFKQDAYTREIEDLSSEGAFREVYPESLFYGHPDQTQKFMDEVKAVVTSDPFNRLQASHPRSFRGRIHENKMTDELTAFFHEEGLIDPEADQSEWLPLETNTSMIYMSLLAKYLSGIDTDATVTGTDREEYLKLSYLPLSGESSIECLDIQFANILPVPREDVPLDRILEFRSDQDRRMELLEFRKLMDDFHRQLSEAPDRRTATLILAQFRETIEKGLSDLTAQLKDARIATVGGSVSTLIQSNASTLGAMLVGAALSVPVAIGGALSGLINVGRNLIGARNERRRELRHSPFSYFYHAEKTFRSNRPRQ